MHLARIPIMVERIKIITLYPKTSWTSGLLPLVWIQYQSPPLPYFLRNLQFAHFSLGGTTKAKCLNTSFQDAFLSLWFGWCQRKVGRVDLQLMGMQSRDWIGNHFALTMNIVTIEMSKKTTKSLVYPGKRMFFIITCSDPVKFCLVSLCWSGRSCNKIHLSPYPHVSDWQGPLSLLIQAGYITAPHNCSPITPAYLQQVLLFKTQTPQSGFTGEPAA